MPNKSQKKDQGSYKKSVSFANVIFKEGDYTYSDSDGIIISKNLLFRDDLNKSENSIIPYKLAIYTKTYK